MSSNTISISELKTRPSMAISQAIDYPVAILKRNQVQAYMVGKELYEKLMTYVEDMVDKKVIDDMDFSQGKDFERVAKELGI